MKFIISIFVFSILCSCNAQKPVPGKINDVGLVTNTDSKESEFSVEYMMGKFDPASHPDFIAIPSKYRDEEIRYIRKDVLAAFIKMYDAAAADGIRIIIRSATRNFENQKRIWENKWTGKTKLEGNVNAYTDIKNEVERARKILEYSSMPGSSRHHWGTDMDFNSLENQWFEYGEGLKVYTWLQTNALKFGFCQPYSKMGSDRNTGFFEEKWHWTYMPVSQLITKQARAKLTNQMLAGFYGETTAGEIDIVNNYILGISPNCANE